MLLSKEGRLFVLFLSMMYSVAQAQVPAPVLKLTEPIIGSNLPAVDRSYLQPEALCARIAVPDSFDWRTIGGLTSVKNQGSTAFCWIFSGFGNLEFKVKTGLGITPNYAEQEVVDCIAGTGGSLHAFYSHVRQHGAVAELDYPYTQVKGSCQGAGKTRYYAPVQTCLLPDDAAGAARNQIKQALMDYGPVSTMMNHNFPALINYRSVQ